MNSGIHKNHIEEAKKDPGQVYRISRKILLPVMVSILAICLLTFLSGCATIRQGLLERIESQQAENPGKDKETPESGATESASAPSAGNAGGSSDNALSETGESELLTSEDTMNSTGPSGSENPQFKYQGIDDRDRQREYFKKGIEFFEEENYLIAQYYFNQIKDTYDILSDHSLYYYAKSLLMQEKYELAEMSYLELKSGFPDSIFSEKANLEYADLFYITQDYQAAEAGYESFIKGFPGSELVTYARYQLAVSQQRNDKFSEAAENFKKIWLEHPESDYAEAAFRVIESLAEEGVIEGFVPTSNQIYGRGELFFDLYRYENALQEFNRILDSTETGSIDAALHAKTLFKTGMCYYNMRDYRTSGDYLSSCYDRFPSGSYADDSLYFMGRAYTNLDQDSTALGKYEEILSRFPSSNYADDALFRMGRIYLLSDDLANAEKYFQRIVNEYPGGDRVKEIYWVLGWIQYKNGDYSTAGSTFSDMANRFGSNLLGEQGLFWKAKCSEKNGENDLAIESYKKIVGYNTFSYYTFAARNALERLGQQVELKSIDTSLYPDNPELEKLLPDVFIEAGTTGEPASTVTEPGTGETAAGNTGTSAGENISPGTGDADMANTGTGSIKFSHIDKAKELLKIEFYDSAAKEIEAASPEIAADSKGILAISTLYLEAKDYINSQQIIAKNLTKLRDNLSGAYKDYLYYLLYPYGYKEYVDKYSAEFGVDPLYILAIIREESRFQPEAGSYAGALGLMQIMPNTGKSIAATIGISGFNNEMLFDPEKNIRMGTYYISAQLDNFNQNKYYACGAYNGGPGAMSKWISRYGNKDIDEFIENISYDETKNYVKKVMGSYFFYQILYGS